MILIAPAFAAWRRLSPSLKAVERRLSAIAAPGLTIAVLVVALYQLHGVSWSGLVRLLPGSPLFWTGFALAYVTPPIADWIIYRRLWGRATVGLGDLLRKAVNNDLLIGFAGEASLYAQVRGRGRAAGEVLSDIKDVSLLSAAVGNGLTIVVALVAWPAWRQLHLTVPVGGAAAAIGLTLLLSPPLLVLLLRRAVLRRGAADLAFVAAAHVARAVATNLLTLAIWRLALPDVSATVWIALLGLKLLASRLPLVSNKELVFAGAAVAVLGAEARAAELLTLIATLTMLVHAGIGVALAMSPRRHNRPAFADVRVDAIGVV